MGGRVVCVCVRVCVWALFVFMSGGGGRCVCACGQIVDCMNVFNTLVKKNKNISVPKTAIVTGFHPPSTPT